MLSGKKSNACNVYVFLWIFGFIQNIYLTSSALSMLFYIPFTLMTIYYIVQITFKYKLKGSIKALFFFFLILCIYGVALLFDETYEYGRKYFLMMLFSSLGPIFPFYVFSCKGQLTKNKMRFFFWILLGVFIINYYKYKVVNTGALDEGITNNTTYYLVGLLPFIFLFEKRLILQSILSACIIGIVLVGMKRGAILIATILIIWFVLQEIKNVSIQTKMGIIFLFLTFVFIGLHFIENLYNNNIYFQRRIEDTLEGNSSGRGILYLTYLTHYLDNDNTLQLIFGEGAWHTENILNLKAHNDWLELLIDCGAFGVSIYLIYWIMLIKDWVKNKANSMLFSIMGSCIAFTFLRTIFSMSFTDMPLPICMMLGYCWGQMSVLKNQTELKEQEKSLKNSNEIPMQL